MALKDWKRFILKDAAIEYSWSNTKSKGSLYLNIIKLPGTKTYEVYLYGNSFSSLLGEKSLTRTKTKSAALKYARAYMRTH